MKENLFFFHSESPLAPLYMHQPTTGSVIATPGPDEHYIAYMSGCLDD